MDLPSLKHLSVWTHSFQRLALSLIFFLFLLLIYLFISDTESNRYTMFMEFLFFFLYLYLYKEDYERNISDIILTAHLKQIVW